MTGQACSCGYSRESDIEGESVDTCPRCGAALAVAESAVTPAINPFTTPLADTPGEDRTAPDPANPYSSPVLQQDAERDEEYVRHAYIEHESSLRQLGLLYYVSAVMLLPAAGILLAGGFRGFSTMLLAFGCIFYGVLNIVLGVGLRRLQNWARILTGLFAIPGLIAIPFGTLISLCILYLVFSSKGVFVCSPAYQQVIACTPHMKQKASVWAVGLLVVTILALTIAAMYFLFE